nr:tripartite tricarboxylate transporter TctB family protein [Thermovirga lienii]
MNKYMVAVMVWSLIWVISIKYIGFFVASVTSMWMIQWSLSSDRDLKSAVKFLAVSVGCVFVIYYTFTKYLYIFFPEGFLF